jgi:calcium/calmodulin-dependent protein kinase I
VDLNTSRKQSLFREKYTTSSVLGQGSYSVVKLGHRIQDGKKVAVKIVSRHRLQKEDELSLRIEVEVLMSLNHPNIVQALDFFEEEDYFYVVLEYLDGGELFERLIEKAVYTEGEARDLFTVLLRAVKYCHDKDLVHRDIKPENILMTSRTDDISLKLADFGFAVKSGVPAAKEQAGTPGYIAPEILQGRPHGERQRCYS